TLALEEREDARHADAGAVLAAPEHRRRRLVVGQPHREGVEVEGEADGAGHANRERRLRAMKARLLAWYAENGRELPWRQTRDPYATLVSEVMLQQTQVPRVVPRYIEWVERWPSAAALAAAPRSDVILAWQGLGYNRRAVN